MYILKTRGTEIIPDYIQIRDNKFALVAHFKAKIAEKELEKTDLKVRKEEIKDLIEKMPYGVLQKID